MKCIINRKGFTLIELIVSLTLGIVILTVVLNYFSFVYKNIYNKYDHIVHMRNTRFALNYIEKRLRDVDQSTIIYHSNLKAFEGLTSSGVRRWIDLSGYMRNSAFIYFNRPTRQLRVNMNSENNVLVPFVYDVAVREIGTNNVVEIEVYASEIDYSVKSRFHVGTINR